MQVSDPPFKGPDRLLCAGQRDFRGKLRGESRRVLGIGLNLANENIAVIAAFTTIRAAGIREAVAQLLLP